MGLARRCDHQDNFRPLPRTEILRSIERYDRNGGGAIQKKTWDFFVKSKRWHLLT